MRPLTANRPKVLLPVAGEPLLHRLLRQLAAAGVRDATVVVHYREEAVRASLGDGRALGLDVTYASQPTPRGTGDAVRVAAPPRDEPFFVANGDVFADDADVRAVVAAGPGTVAAAEASDARDLGVFRTDEQGRAVGVVEKSPTPPSRLVNAGLYYFPAGFARRLDALTPSPRGELELTDALHASMREDGAYRVATFKSWLDVGRPWHLLAATERALSGVTGSRIEGTIERGATVHGPLELGAGSVVKAGAYVEGPVVVGRDSVVGPNCHIRPFTAIGNRCKVGNACEVKASILLDGTHVGHLSYVGDSVLGERVNLGAGTLVANLRHDGRTVNVAANGERVDSGRRKLGVILGDDVHTGINTSLNVGVVLAAGTTTRPGEVVMESRPG